jgi:SAM-dependent methyltransferase
MAGTARYDGLAEWYDREMVGPGITRDTVLRLLGDGPGRLLDVACGTGAHSAALAERGWTVTGVDISEDQLRLARQRGVDVVQADAADLPFDDAEFDAAVSMWLHTDTDEFESILRQIARVVRPGARFVFVGAHPCFVGPHAYFPFGKGVPELHPGYRNTGWYEDAPGISPHGLRAKVGGAAHIPLGLLVQAFLDAGFMIERFEEPQPPDREYPHMLALACRR